jgi:uncharacterized coiled-coil protein SlyX
MNAGRMIVLLAALSVGCNRADDTARLSDRVDALERTLAEQRATITRLEQENTKARADLATANATAAKADTVRRAAADAQSAARTAEETEERRRVARQAYELLPPLEQKEVDRIRKVADPQDLSQNDVRYLARHLTLFPDVDQDALMRALIVMADDRGAGEHVRILGLTDPKQIKALKIAFALADDDTITTVKALGPAVRAGESNLLGDDSKAFIRQHPELFPRP